MATWRSTDTVKWDMYTGFDYAKCENSWEYGTVSDYLRVTTKIGQSYKPSGEIDPPSENSQTYSQEEALALLETLIDWAMRYEGEGVVREMVNKRLK